MNRGRIITIFGLLLFCVIVILPPLIHGYIYPTVGDDTAAHLAIFDRIKAGTYGNVPMILSYRVIGYPLAWVSNWSGLSVDVLFLWFNYIALILIGLTIYIVVARLIDKKAGWLALVVTLFGAQGILFQFYYGQVFNAINMGIILPLLLFFSVRYLTQGRVYQFILAILFGVLFGAFHTSGVYLPFVAGLTTVVYLVYRLFKRARVNLRVVSLGGSLVFLSAIAFLVSITNVDDLWNAVFHQLNLTLSVPITSFLMGIVSPTVLVMLAFVVVFLKDILKNISFEGKMLAVILLCMSVVLAVAAFAKLSLDPFRQALDLSTVLALLAVVLVGAIAWKPKNQVIMVVLLLAVGFGLYHNLPTWFSYNSAISKADKEAIAYVNTLNRVSYNTSPEVAFWIYDRFTEAKYSENAMGILIVRNIAMTPRSDPKNKWFQEHGVSPDKDYRLLESFKEGKTIVEVYEKVVE